MGQRLNGPLIKAMRKAAGQGQEDLAAIAGISERSVRDAERGTPVGIDVCIRLATALRVDPPDQLFVEKGLRLDQVRRLPDSASLPGPSNQPVAEIGRVHFAPQGRRDVRQFLLRQLTPTSGHTLQGCEVSFDKDSVSEWPKESFEGFVWTGSS